MCGNCVKVSNFGKTYVFSWVFIYIGYIMKQSGEIWGLIHYRGVGI